MAKELKAHNPYYGPQGGYSSYPRHIDDLYIPFIPDDWGTKTPNTNTKNWDAVMRGGHVYKLYGDKPNFQMEGSTYGGGYGWQAQKYSIFMNTDMKPGQQTNMGGRLFDDYSSITSRENTMLCKNSIVNTIFDFFNKDSTYKCFAFYWLANSDNGRGTMMPVSGITMDIELIRNAIFPDDSGNPKSWSGSGSNGVKRYDWQIAYVHLVFWDYDRNMEVSQKVLPNGDNWGNTAQNIDIDKNQYVFRDTDDPAEYAGGSKEAIGTNSYWYKLYQAGKGEDSNHKTTLHLLLPDKVPPLKNAMFLGFDICCYVGFEAGSGHSKSFSITNVGVIDEVTRNEIKKGTAHNMKHRVVHTEKAQRGVSTVGRRLEYHAGNST